MAEAIFESSPVAEESWEFMKRKREYEVEDEEEESDSDVESCKFSDYEDIEELTEGCFPDDDDVSMEFREYTKQLRMSGGFNVPMPPKGTIGCIWPLSDRAAWWPFAEEGAVIAVAHYNENRAPPDGKLQVVRLETVNRAPVAGSLFYITFEGEYVNNGERKMYQTKLYRRFDGYWQVLLFRKKKHEV